MNSPAERVPFVCTGINIADAEAQATTAVGGGFVEADSDCADIVESPEVHFPIGGIVTKHVNLEAGTLAAAAQSACEANAYNAIAAERAASVKDVTAIDTNVVNVTTGDGLVEEGDSQVS